MPIDNKPLPDGQLSTFTAADIAWMAGLLEGEGYFCCLRNGLAVRLVMTDEDVMERFARFWEVKPRQLSKRADHHKIPFLVALPSKKAAQCMRLILPFLGQRRMQVVDACLRKYEQQQQTFRANLRLRQEKFTDGEFLKLWGSRPAGEALRPFCKRVGLGNRTAAKQRLQRLGLTPSALSANSGAIGEKVDLLTAPTEVQAAWMAGLLEGEAHFYHRGGGAAAVLTMSDRDVVDLYASLAGVRSYQAAPAREAHYKPIFVAIASGHRGATVMERILPYMGERRSAKIKECLQARELGQAKKQAIRAKHEARFPADVLVPRWTTRAAGETLSTLSREYGVHPQIMKDRLLELGIYEAPTYKINTDVPHICELCGAPFVRPASFRGGQYCSRVCSGRAQAQRRAAQRKAALTAA